MPPERGLVSVRWHRTGPLLFDMTGTLPRQTKSPAGRPAGLIAIKTSFEIANLRPARECWRRPPLADNSSVRRPRGGVSVVDRVVGLHYPGSPAPGSGTSGDCVGDRLILGGEPQRVVAPAICDLNFRLKAQCYVSVKSLRNYGCRSPRFAELADAGPSPNALFYPGGQ